MKRILAFAAILAIPAAVALAGTKNVALPSGYKTNSLRYATIDKTSKRGPRVREIYANKKALKALKAGRSLPSGTVLVMEVYTAKTDAMKNPVKDAKGRFVKSGLRGIFVMEKRDGWGAKYPTELRNGNWEYARFDKAGKRHKKLSMKSCMACHKSQAEEDFVFTFPALKKAAR
jgi:hypothetical protein